MDKSGGEGPRKRRTIVGGRPRGKDKPGTEIPRGVETLLKMAAIDPDFRRRLIQLRGTASKELGFKLTSSEAMILKSAPEDQLQAMIDAMPVSDDERSDLLSLAPQTGLPSDPSLLTTLGIRPEPTEKPPRPPPTRGIRPDLPIKPPRPPRSKGIRPDED